MSAKISFSMNYKFTFRTVMPNIVIKQSAMKIDMLYVTFEIRTDFITVFTQYSSTIWMMLFHMVIQRSFGCKWLLTMVTLIHCLSFVLCFKMKSHIIFVMKHFEATGTHVIRMLFHVVIQGSFGRKWVLTIVTLIPCLSFVLCFKMFFRLHHVREALVSGVSLLATLPGILLCRVRFHLRYRNRWGMCRIT